MALARRADNNERLYIYIQEQRFELFSIMLAWSHRMTKAGDALLGHKSLRSGRLPRLFMAGNAPCPVRRRRARKKRRNWIIISLWSTLSNSVGRPAAACLVMHCLSRKGNKSRTTSRGSSFAFSRTQWIFIYIYMGRDWDAIEVVWEKRTLFPFQRTVFNQVRARIKRLQKNPQPAK